MSREDFPSGTAVKCVWGMEQHSLGTRFSTVFESIVPDTRWSVINQATRDALQAWTKDAHSLVLL